MPPNGCAQRSSTRQGQSRHQATEALCPITPGAMMTRCSAAGFLGWVYRIFSNDDRRRVMRQLNKGEALHDLRAYLIANKGQLRRKRGDELVNQASCLNLVTNAVILWNTVYMAEAIAQLK